ncbi:heterokaryon incompatibility protein-domain-containing protein [Stachybotrys elegans]|uniref:Heterokaryon incompatibility protein-domain-containing protein n=1 Tax=Stachybotrys elegans TaxID=80388 RepID=A0A8K0WTA4_9HYPO|nr:heterokaryon incompatibility protein-domain-containing protein [Stachybotrys elegans]
MGQEPDYICQRCRAVSFNHLKIVDGSPPAEFGKEFVEKEYGFMPLDYELRDTLPHLPTLQASIDENCALCSFLRQVILSQVGAEEDSLGTTETPICLRLREYHPEFGSVRFCSTREAWRPSRIEGEIEVGGKTLPVSIDTRDQAIGFFSHLPDADVLSSNTIRNLQRAIHTCKNNSNLQHEECTSPGIKSAPLRLLNISQSPKVYLQDTDGMDLQYAILSYCWGISSVAFNSRTIMSNLDARKKGFHVTTLPPLMQDSIIVARSLGESHIWIDALCIVQDSGEWKYESLKMMQYYERAVFTITPFDCSGAEEAFLKTRPAWVSRQIRWPGPRNWHLEFIYPSYVQVNETSTSAVWLSRGWTYQEQILSSRIIYIGHDEVKFRCRSAWLQGHRPELNPQPSVETFLPLSETQARKSHEWNSMDMIRFKWYKVVSRYSARQLTQRSDKLIALSGIVSKFEQLMGSRDKFMEGFWEADLWHGLTWRETVYGNTKWPEKATDFPSWSWCSMYRPLGWQDGADGASDAELIEAISAPERGQLSQINLLLVRTWVFHIQHVVDKVPGEISITFYLDSGEEFDLESGGGDDIRVAFLAAYLDGGDRDEWARSPASTPHDLCGLLLWPTGERHKTYVVYRRIGVVDIQVDMDFSSDEGGAGAVGDMASGINEKGSVLSWFQSLYSDKEVIALA